MKTYINHLASVDVYTRQTLVFVCVDQLDDVYFRHVWPGTRAVDRLSWHLWDVTLGYPTTMNEFTLFMDVMPNLFIQDTFL